MKALRQWILRRLLRPELVELIKALEAPTTFKAFAPLTVEEVRHWESLIKTPGFIRIDEAMYDWLNTIAQEAIASAPGEVLAKAKFAYGCRAAWETAKRISRMPIAEDEHPEDKPPTAGEILEQHEP